MADPGTIQSQLPSGDDYVAREIADLKRDLRELGPSIARSFNTTIATLTSLVSGLQAQVAAAISANSLTTAQINSKVANPGDIAPTSVTSSGAITATDVTASGRVNSAVALRSIGSFSYRVSTNYQGMWINDDGTIGISASTRASKKDLVPLTDLGPLMALKPKLGRYVWDAETDHLKQFLIAEDVAEAGFGPDVAPLGKDGQPLSVNYSQLVPALIAKVQEMSARLDAAGI